MSLRIIVIGGLSVFLVMAMIPVALKRGLKPDPRQRVRVMTESSPFDGALAYEHVAAAVAYGPRPTGSAALREMNRYVVRTLREAGVRVDQDVPVASDRDPGLTLLNVVGIVHGSKPGVVLLGCHYDTYGGGSKLTPGANHGASAPAVLLELARTTGGRRDGLSIWLCFWDGGVGSDPEHPATLGSALHLDQWHEAGRLGEVRAALILDAVGDCYLGIRQDTEAPAWLRDTVRSAASMLGYDRHFVLSGEPLPGDHVVARRAGLPTLTLTDERYGGSIVEHRRFYNTAEDTVDKVCPESLQAVGDVIYHALLTLDALQATPSD